MVREIFTAFAGGHSPKQIARGLNDRRVPGPRGGIWRDTTIRGHHQRASGILRNALHAGVLVFNRQGFSRNPADAAKRVASLNDESDWVRLNRLMVELEGDLVALLSLGLGPNAAKAGASQAAGLRERVRSVMVVAGAGFEPAAFRL
ncbi:recombinase family protein [Azospirillum sp. A29]|uniref:recombinase family protein n=1 Tax=Azospirillum sp. A29 TaxID=3160606 RepID=UPI00366DBE83